MLPVHFNLFSEFEAIDVERNALFQALLYISLDMLQGRRRVYENWNTPAQKVYAGAF